LSINAIARHLNQQQIATRRGDTRWERSTVWALLRNPAYQGKACYGKTEIQPRQRITRLDLPAMRPLFVMLMTVRHDGAERRPGWAPEAALLRKG